MACATHAAPKGENDLYVEAPETGVHMGATVQTPDSHLLAAMKGISLDS